MLTTNHRASFASLPIVIKTYTFDYKNGIFPNFIIPSYITNDRIVTFSPHNHEEPEFIVIREGRLNAAINDKEYLLSDGDMLIVNPYDLHSAYTLTSERLSYTYMIFGFSMITDTIANANQVITGLNEGHSRFKNHIGACESTKRLAELMSEIESVYPTQSLTDDLNCASAVFGFMSILLSEIGLCDSNTPSRDLDFIRKVSELIVKHYTERLSTADAAAQFGYNESYFCEIFRRSFGESFMSYLNNYRINRALNGDGSNLAELARSVGFHDYCHFNRCFKRKTNLTPSEYFAKKSSQL